MWSRTWPEQQRGVMDGSLTWRVVRCAAAPGGRGWINPGEEEGSSPPRTLGRAGIGEREVREDLRLQRTMCWM